MAKANIGAELHEADAETAPLEAAQYYQYDLDLSKVSEVWRRGSVISSSSSTSPPKRSTPTAAARRVLGRRQRLEQGRLDNQRRDRRGACRCRSSRPPCTNGSPRPGRCGRQGPLRHGARSAGTTNERNPLDDVLPHRRRADDPTSPRPTPSCCSAPPGDLAKRKLFPALYRLQRSGTLTVPVIGVAGSNSTTTTSHACEGLDHRAHRRRRPGRDGRTVRTDGPGAGQLLRRNDVGRTDQGPRRPPGSRWPCTTWRCPPDMFPTVTAKLYIINLHHRDRLIADQVGDRALQQHCASVFAGHIFIDSSPARRR